MFRMFKLLFMMALFAGFAWFGSTVKLGERTLFGHLQAIGSTKESKELVDGTKQSAKPLVDDVRRRIAGETTTTQTPASPPGSPAVAASPDAGPPQDNVTAADRRQLRRLIGTAEPKTAHR